MPAERAEVPMADPQAGLERALRDEYLRSRGCTQESIKRMPENEARAIERDASLYCATKLAEVEARASYVHEIHGAAE